jgi:hypothetical protein
MRATRCCRTGWSRGSTSRRRRPLLARREQASEDCSSVGRRHTRVAACTLACA